MCSPVFPSRRSDLPAKYFYDAAGSQLFDRIAELDEYYLDAHRIEDHAANMPGKWQDDAVPSAYLSSLERAAS